MTQWPKNGLPKARSADLITERIGDEIVAYDGLTSEAHCLGALASAVFLAADGETSISDLALIATAETNETVNVEQIEQAVAELEERGLIVANESSGISRRQLMQRGAAAGGAVVAASMVTSVVTPAYGQTASASLPSGNSFSGLAILVQCTDGTWYWAQWGKTTIVNAGSNAVAPDGYSNTAGNCCFQLDAGSGQQMTATNPPSPIPTLKVVYDGSALAFAITVGTDCQITEYVIKCGLSSATQPCYGTSSCPGGSTGSTKQPTVVGNAISGTGPTYIIDAQCQ